MADERTDSTGDRADRAPDGTDGADGTSSAGTRRRFLAALGASGALAGCLGALTASSEERDTATPTLTPAPTGDGTAGESGSGGSGAPTPTTTVDTSLAAQGIPSTICDESIRSNPGIYAITDPAFDSDWSGREIGLGYRHDRDHSNLVDEQTIVGLTTDDGRARAYPLTVLSAHEIVNDDFGGPVIVTYCPLCRSGMVADRRVNGEVTQFGVSGLLWQPERVYGVVSEEDGRVFGATWEGGEQVSVRHSGNLVMYDATTHSFWSQMLARAICGSETGDLLSIRPSTVATWGEWRAEHPDTEVLLPPPDSTAIDPGVVLGGEK